MPTSGASFSTDDFTDLVFSTDANTCVMADTNWVTAGGTYVQIFSLGSKPGTYRGVLAKVVTVDASCRRNQEVDLLRGDI